MLICAGGATEGVPWRALDAVPPGGGIGDAMRFLTEPSAIRASVMSATRWVELVIRAVQEAVEPNPWKNATDEEIAGMILEKTSERRQNQ